MNSVRVKTFFLQTLQLRASLLPPKADTCAVSHKAALRKQECLIAPFSSDDFLLQYKSATQQLPIKEIKPGTKTLTRINSNYC